MDVNLEYYRIFYQVAKYGSFTKAARVLGSSQPNVTRAMNGLEQQIGCRLFIRTNRGIRLTPEGDRLQTRVSAAMAQLQTAEKEIAGSVGLEHGAIVIGASETALNLYLLDKLREFHESWPGVRLKIHNHSTPQAIRAVESREADFAVVTTPADTGPPLKQTNVRTFREILVGGRGFAQLGRDEISIKELGKYPLICLGQETMTRRFYQQLFLKYGLELNPDTEAATADQILPLVKCGLGLGFVPEPMAREELQKKNIVEIRLKEEIPERNVCIVYDGQRPPGAAAQRLKTTLLAGCVG